MLVQARAPHRRSRRCRPRGCGCSPRSPPSRPATPAHRGSAVDASLAGRQTVGDAERKRRPARRSSSRRKMARCGALAARAQTERRGRDSNPRRTKPPETVFETAAFNRSATPPDDGCRLEDRGQNGIETRGCVLAGVPSCNAARRTGMERWGSASETGSDGRSGVCRVLRGGESGPTQPRLRCDAQSARQAMHGIHAQAMRTPSRSRPRSRRSDFAHAERNRKPRTQQRAHAAARPSARCTPGHQTD
jgi:hypothetical protein